MRAPVKCVIWPGAFVALMTAGIAAAHAQNENKGKPPPKPGDQGGATQQQGGMGQMMGGPGGTT